ncbi:acetyltransferase [Rhodococcus sp. 15-1154-1]|nr:acetyltransferase [Rhodococcus sp. 15-1154-1]
MMGIRAVLAEDLAQVVRDVVLNKFISSSAVPRRLRTVLLRLTGHDIHPTARFNPHTFLGSWSGLTMGENTFLNYKCFLDLGAPITLGDNSGLGYESMLITCSHDVGPEWRRFGKPVNMPIVIGEGVWIGSRVMVLPGVTIGDGCVVVSGSVVTSDCEPNSVYAGVPAKFKRRLTTSDDTHDVSIQAGEPDSTA